MQAFGEWLANRAGMMELIVGMIRVGRSKGRKSAKIAKDVLSIPASYRGVPYGFCFLFRAGATRTPHPSSPFTTETPPPTSCAFDWVQVDAMAAEGTPYVGVLYAGLMLTPPSPTSPTTRVRSGAGRRGK